MKKRIAALILAVLMVVTLVGCGSKVKTSEYGTTEVIKLGGQSIYLDELNYYVRTNQYEMEKDNYLTDNGVKTWDQEINFYDIIIYTLKEELLFQSVSELRQVYVLCDQAAKEKITLTADEEAKVAQAAKDFLANSEEDLLELINLSEARLVEILRRNALANKMYEASIADVDTEVTKEEALKYDVSYIYISKDNLAKIKDLEKDATPETVAKKIVERVNGGEKLEDVLKDYKDGLKSTAATMADGENEKTYGKTAEKLKVGEAGCVAYGTSGAYYLVVRDSDYNEKATEENKGKIAEKRIADHFAKVYKEWEDAISFDPDYKMIDNLPVSEPIYTKPATESTTGADKTTDAAEESTEAVEESTEAVEGTTAADETEEETK
ncbi:MAG: SurA N-terminal domain-containing protein [Lachnospiraceae bacterium]|nr:SurA N-terminal domain-containing protein [Lachnospiraceae bacterium]